jgi:hypothetical protein
MIFCTLQELLYEKHLSLDGSKLEETGFKCEHGKLTTDNLKEVNFTFVIHVQSGFPNLKFIFPTRVAMF